MPQTFWATYPAQGHEGHRQQDVKATVKPVWQLKVFTDSAKKTIGA